MSFSTCLADLAGSKPSELQQLQALEVDLTLGSMPETAGELDCLRCTMVVISERLRWSISLVPMRELQCM